MNNVKWQNEKMPNLSHGVSYTIVGTIIVVLLTLLSVLLMGLVSTWFAMWLGGGKPTLSLLLRFTPCVTVNFIALECIFVLWDKKVPRRNRIVLLIALLLLVGSMLVCATDVMLCQDDGLHRIVLGKETKTYGWCDVVSATIGGTDAGISVSLRFRGSKSVSLTNNSTAVTKAFDETYGTVLGYAVYVRDCLTANGTFVTVTADADDAAKYKDTNDALYALDLVNETP